MSSSCVTHDQLTLDSVEQEDEPDKATQIEDGVSVSNSVEREQENEIKIGLNKKIEELATTWKKETTQQAYGVTVKRMSYLSRLTQSHKEVSKAIEVDDNPLLVQIQEEIELLRLEIVNAKCEVSMNNAILCFEEINIRLGIIFQKVREKIQSIPNDDNNSQETITEKIHVASGKTKELEEAKDEEFQTDNGQTISQSIDKEAPVLSTRTDTVDNKESNQERNNTKYIEKLDNMKSRVNVLPTPDLTEDYSSKKVTDTHDPEIIYNIASVYPTNGDKLIIKQGINAKVIEVVNKTKSETVYILNDKKYLPDDKLPRKLIQRMTKFGSKIENKLRSALTEIQQENKDTAMHFIRDIDIYLKVYRAWKENKTAKFFFRLENEAW